VVVESLERLLARLGDGDRVLDIGGWAAPLNRADWVIDLMPYETRGALPVGSFGPGPERFCADTWVQRDICAHDPYPFDDDFFDFAVCTFTLEDIRDPIWVCEEMSRIARAGLIEVPSLVDELSWNVPEFSGGPWVGHDHHRWLCFTGPNSIEFMHRRTPSTPSGARRCLRAAPRGCVPISACRFSGGRATSRRANGS